MKLGSLISATLVLATVAFLVLEVMSGDVVFWVAGMMFFFAVAFRLLDLESKRIRSPRGDDKNNQILTEVP